MRFPTAGLATREVEEMLRFLSSDRRWISCGALALGLGLAGVGVPTSAGATSGGFQSAGPTVQQAEAQVNVGDVDVTKMVAELNQAKSELKTLLAEAKSHDGSVSIETMFKLQLQMQVMSQYVEAVSNALSAIHQAMLAMARATKGQ
jgi:hypothetical protein